ncbi:MAG TPA: 2-dehydro-3-deoxygalactonokinase [Woeseiaceae bacterium]|nr:2-dehydro-3-deoxygalactonokinase [Woeseiaceae bacterium]
MHEHVSVQGDVLGDWGTSRLRLYLVNDGRIAHTCEGPGTAALAGSSPEARLEVLTSLVRPWGADREALPVWLAGMAGSRNGLFEVPCAGLPADCKAWARAAESRDIGALRITTAAGIAARGPADVMRGEETQVFGALALEPALATGRQLAVLPGTHSKWIEIADGWIARFRTALTGELYALLCEKSILLRAAAEAQPDDIERDQSAGFDAGVARSADADAALLPTLFETRAVQVLEGRSRNWAAGFLSGLLIGHEIRELSALFDTSGVVSVIGESELSMHYERVLARRGIESRVFDGGQCTVAGLMRLQTLGEAP